MSGATDYQSLCLTAKTEEKRLAEIKKRRQYHSEHKYKNTSSSRQDSSNSRSPSNPQSGAEASRQASQKAVSYAGSPLVFQRKSSTVRCWNCRRTGHIAADCKAPKREESDQPFRWEKPTNTRQVQSFEDQGPHDQDPQPSPETTPTTSEDPRQYLLPDSDEEEPAAGVNEVRVQDKGSYPQSVHVVVAGVPVDGIVVTAADINCWR